MPTQKRVPLRKKREIQVENKPNIQQLSEKSIVDIEQINNVDELVLFLDKNNCGIVGLIRKYMSKLIENPAFENQRIHFFLRLCLDYMTEVVPEKICKEKRSFACPSITQFVETIKELSVSYKWGMIEWTQKKLKEISKSIPSIAILPPDFFIELSFAIEVISGIVGASEGVENPILQTLMAFICSSLELLSLRSLDDGYRFFLLYWQLLVIAEENNQVVPEAIAYFKKLANFACEKINTVAREVIPPEQESKPLTIIDILLSQDLAKDKLEETFIQGIAKVTERLCNMFISHNSYQLVAVPIEEIVMTLYGKQPVIAKCWNGLKGKQIAEAKVKEKIKIPLQLQEEKQTEIRSFEPIIEETFIPSKNKFREKTPLDEKRATQKLKKVKRVEFRKMQKQTKIREEIRMEQFGYIKEKHERELKAARKAAAEGFM